MVDAIGGVNKGFISVSQVRRLSYSDNNTIGKLAETVLALRTDINKLADALKELLALVTGRTEPVEDYELAKYQQLLVELMAHVDEKSDGWQQLLDMLDDPDSTATADLRERLEAAGHDVNAMLVKIREIAKTEAE